MRILIQRVRRASVSIGGTLKSAIGPGLLVFVGIEAEDGEEDIEWLAGKLTRLRIFDDETGVLYQGGPRSDFPTFVRAVRRRCRPCARARSRHRGVRSRYAGRAGERRAGDDLDRLPTTRITSVISKIVKDERNRAGLHAEIAESDPI